MSDNKTEYEISLKDLFLNKIKAADAATEKMDRRVHGLKSSLSELAGVAATAFGVYAGIEFLKSSAEGFMEAEEASAQLNATLASTKHAAGLSREALDEQATALSKMTKFDDDAITKMQSLLLTFTNIKDTVFQEATPAILDLATKMGGDLQGASIQVGKALNDPIKGITALTRVGVSFTEQQKEQIKKMVEMGNVAGAQRMILKELNTEFGGSAKAAGETMGGQLQILKNEFDNLKESIGEMIMKGLIRLKPYMISFINGFREAIKWVKEHKTVIKTFFVALAAGVAAFYAYKAAIAITNVVSNAMFLVDMIKYIASTQGLSFATAAATVAQNGLNAAMLANPVGIVIAAVAALAAAIYLVIENYQKLKEEYNANIDKNLKQATDDQTKSVYQLAEAYEKQGLSAQKAQAKALEVERKQAQIEYQRAKDMVAKAQEEINGSPGVGMMEEQAQEQMRRAMAQLNIASARRNTLFDKNLFNKAKDGKQGLEGLKGETGTDKVKGPQHTQITINIDKLIEKIEMHTTTITEGAGNIKEILTKAIIETINDAQIVGGI